MIKINDHAFLSSEAEAYRPCNILERLLYLFLKLPSCISTRLSFFQARLSFQKAQIGKSVLIGANARLVNFQETSGVKIGEGSVVRGILRSGDGHGKNAHLNIAEDVYIGDDCIISCFESIEIGSNTLIAHGVQIFDNDSHPILAHDRVEDWKIVRGLKPGPRNKIRSAPVSIGANCWIGMNSIITKGVSVGEGSVLAAGSVLSQDVPANSVVGGNPAQVIKKL